MRSQMHKRPIMRFTLSFFVGILVAFCIFYYVSAVESESFTPILQFGQSKNIIRLFILMIFCIVASMLIAYKGRLLARILFQYRWLIALSLFTLCVCFELSGSSVGILINNVGGDGSTIAGISRQVRSDEWMVFTPMALSQCVTDGGAFSYFQDSMRAVETDMFLIYGQPVWDIAILFRPFQWGYLILGAAKGLSFFWCGRLIFLFMVSFEFARALFKIRSNWFNVAYAFFITFAGVVQWWFSINAFVEMLIFGQLAIIWAKCYLISNNYWKRLLFSIGIAWCLIIFILTVYPAWEIPLAYVFLAVFIGLMVEMLPSSKKSSRDVFLVLLTLALVICAIVYVVCFKSWDTVQIEANTAYPGQRSLTGGGAGSNLLYYLYSIITPVDGRGVPENVCEFASFYTLFPLSLIIPILALNKCKALRPYIISLLICIVFLGVYVIIGYPELIAKLSLLSKSAPYRAVVALEYALVLVLFFSLNCMSKISKKSAVIAVIVSVLFLLICVLLVPVHEGSFDLILSILIVLVLMVAILRIPKQRGLRNFGIACIVVSLLTGALVNPIRSGLDGYMNTDLALAIKQSGNSENVWASTDISLSTNNYPASLGYKTLNSTNVYPQIETWEKLDPNHENEEIYNRYAHIRLYLTDGEPKFDLVQADVFSLSLSVDDLAMLGVDRILSVEADYQERFDDIKLLSHTGRFYIYAIEAE